ncbi:MAG: toll/interleukin-1 receptor domain-containing protein [Chitinophagaceae bacterium]
MKQLATFRVKQLQKTASVELLYGDLSAIPSKHATDILVMSAFPGNYIALKGSLIYALNEKGLSVESLSRDKETDLRHTLNCWLSKPLSLADQQKFNFKKILCFEPGEKIKEPDEVVGDIFRCINSFAFDEDNNELAMPIIGTGYQQVSLDKMLPALLTACHFWLSNGLPLQNIKLVVHDKEKAEQALGLFNEFKKTISQKPAQKFKKINSNSKPMLAPLPKRYDYFLSYAHTHSKDIQLFVEELKNKNKKLSVFYDKDSIPPGGLWIQQISAAIQQADQVLIFLSPDYDQSPVCWDEFQCAKLMEYNLKKSIIKTVYLYGHQQSPMPLIMGIYSYIDCREGNKEKLKHCVETLVK